MDNRDVRSSNGTSEAGDSVEIDLLEVLFYIWERIWIILVCAVLCGAAAFVSSNYLMTERFESTVTAWVMSSRGDASGGTINYNDIQVNTQMANDYIEIITSRTVLETVIAQEHLSESAEDLKKRIRVEKKPDTRMITITVTDDDPVRAQELANAVYGVASQRIVDVMKAEEVNVTPVDEANLPMQPSSPNVKKYTVLGTLLGAFISIVLLICLFMLDDSIKTDEDVEKYLGFTTLAVIPLIEEEGKNGKSIKKSPHSTSKSNTRKMKTSSAPREETEDEE